MMRRILYILLIVGAIGAIVYVYFELNAGKTDNADPWQVVSPNAVVILSWQAGSEGVTGREWLRSYQRPDDDLGFPALLLGLRSMMQHLDSLCTSGERWKDQLQDKRIVAYNRSAVSADSWVVVIPADVSKAEDLSLFLADLTGPSSLQSEVSGTEVFTSSQGNISVAHIKDCFVMSASMSALEDAVRNDKDGNSLSSARMLYRARQQVAMDAPVQMFFRDDNDWWHLDLVNVEGSFQLAGFVHVSDSSGNQVSLAGSGASPEIIPLIPDHTELFEVRNYTDFQEGWNLSGEGKVGTNEEAYWSRAWGDIGDSCSCDLNDAVLNWRAGEWGSFMVPFDGRAHTIEFVKSASDANALQMLRPVLSGDSIVESGYAIHSVKYPEAFERNARRYFGNHAAFLVVYGGYVFMSAEREALTGLVKAIVNKDTWDGMALWQDAFQKLGENSGQLYFQDIYSISLLPEPFVNCFGSARPIIVSVSKMKDGLYRANLLLGASTQNVGSHTADSSKSEKWTVRLGNKVRRAPQLVRNHKSGGFDVVVQTEDNFLRCIDASGTELWSYQVDGPVVGDIAQVDALKNEKLQLAFVAGKKLYVIDRNGNNLTGFPQQLRAEPVTGIRLIDYDLSRNYRLMGGLSDGSVFNFTVDGTPAQGWIHQPGRKVHAISNTKVGNDDVLVMVHDDGSVKCFKRNGQLRYDANARFDIYPGAEIFCRGAIKPEEIEICALVNGSSLVSKRLGSDKALNTADVGSSSQTDIRVADLNGDRTIEIILSHSNSVQVYKSNAESLMKFDSPQLLSGPATVVMSGKEKGLLLTLADGTCKLIDISGNVKAEMNGESVMSMVAGDLDLDGFLEFIGVRADEVYARGIDAN